MMKEAKRTKNVGTCFTWTWRDRACFIASAVVVALLIYFGLR
jgi:hypothetical protein